MGITAARDTLDAALGQKVQTAGGMVAKPCQIGRQKNRRTPLRRTPFGKFC
jgi:hypothetical protein